MPLVLTILLPLSFFFLKENGEWVLEVKMVKNGEGLNRGGRREMKWVMGKWGVFNGINLGRVGRWEVEGLCLLIKGFKEGRGEVTGGGRLKTGCFL